MSRPEHLFISSSDGAMYDTRMAGWHSLPPLRANYECGHTTISNVSDLKAVLRHGAYTSLGCYPLYFITSDGAALSFDAVREEIRQVMQAVAERDTNSGWRVVACDINYEDTELYCDHTGERIESAYGED